MIFMKKRVFFVLFSLILIFTLSAAALAPSLEESAQTGLAGYREAFQNTATADVWSQLLRQAAGQLTNADYAFLSPQVDVAALLNLTTDLESNPQAATELAKAIIALRSGGLEPSHSDVQQLVQALAALQGEDGSFGEDTVSTAMALVALRTVGYKDFDMDKAVSALVAHKLSDGGYNDWGAQGSPDSTALVMLGFAASGTNAAKQELAGAIAFLKSIWQEDGFFVGTGEYDAPNICTQATVLLALVTAGEDVTSEAWKKGGVSIADTILGLQDESGIFWYSQQAMAGEDEWFPEPDQYSSLQALLGLYARLNGSPISKLFVRPESESESKPVVSKPAEAASKAPAKSDNPDTGDAMSPLVWAVLIAAVVLIAGAVVLPIIQKKNKK